jgi:hypothetical protein
MIVAALINAVAHGREEMNELGRAGRFMVDELLLLIETDDILTAVHRTFDKKHKLSAGPWGEW